MEEQQQTYVCVSPLGIFVIYGTGNVQEFVRDTAISVYETIYQAWDWRKQFTDVVDRGITNPNEV